MSMETLLYEKDNGVVTVTLNRPQRLNALNYQLASELCDVIDQIEADNDARAVILTGAGKGFCAGADIKEVVDPNAKKLPIGKRYSFFNKLEDVTVPIIAAINGPCNGGGLELALCCDFIIAAESASFGLGEVKLGVIPAGGGTARLPRLIGPRLAKEFLYFGNRIDGKEADRIGLANKAVPLDELMTESKKWATELAEKAPLAIKALKYCVNVGMQMDMMSALEYENQHAATLINSEDCKEGMMAFVEKRKAVFKGK